MRIPSLSSLRRITSGGRYVPEIDGLRFIAIGSVLLYHVHMMAEITSGSSSNWSGMAGFIESLVDNGGRGVQIFFAISGMVLGLPFARHRFQGAASVRIKPYLLRRVTRLEPPYIFNLLLRAPLVMVAKHLSAIAIALHLSVSVFYADWLVYHTMPTIHPPSWSLAIEVQFYLLAPFLAFLLYRNKPWVRRTIFVVAIALTSIVSAHLKGPELHGIWKLSIVAFSQFFLVGMLAADVYVTSQPRMSQTLLWDLVGIPLWVAVFAVPEPLAFYILPPTLLILIPASFLGRLLNRFFRTPFVYVLGGMCYSIYLVHSLVYEAVYTAFHRIIPHASYATLAVSGLLFVIPLSLTAGATFYVLIERPCMEKDWPTKLWNRWKRYQSHATHDTPV